MDMNSLNGWQRLLTFISISWVICAGALYLSVLDEYVGNSHYWIELWHKLNPFASFVTLFENGNGLGSGRPSFDSSGFLYFIAFPPGVLWALGYGIAWVRSSFVKK